MTIVDNSDLQAFPLMIPSPKTTVLNHLYNHAPLQEYNSCNALTRKEEIEMLNHKHKVFLVHKWAVLKKIKEEMKESNMQAYIQMKYARRFVVHILAKVTLKAVA